MSEFLSIVFVSIFVWTILVLSIGPDKSPRQRLYDDDD